MKEVERISFKFRAVFLTNDETRCSYISDINECVLPNECEQLCSNTVGGYRCQCDQGYRLDTSDGRSCIGKCKDIGSFQHYLMLLTISTSVIV